jgi:CDP-diacylglycerol--serine O-phosphatidyltransferase
METPFQPFDPNGDENARRGPRIREIPLRLVVPNLVTVLAMCAGLSGIRLAFQERFETAVAMVLLAALLDALDGRIARRLKATSKFGAQLDSLADVINFGVAPALVLYAYSLDHVRSLGWIAALIYVIATALRLARFNVMAESTNKPAWQADFFVGVPAPAGAVLVMLPIYSGFLGFRPDEIYASVTALYAIAIAFLLISRVPIFSGKSAKGIRRDLVVPLILGIAVYVLLLMSYTWETMTFSAIAYLAFIPYSTRMFNKRYAAEQARDAPQND